MTKTIDLDDVESRIKHTSENDYAWLLGTRSGAALFAGVERLRLDLADIEHAYKFACDKAKLLERAAVVAWLRDEAKHYSLYVDMRRCEIRADNIERGEHRNKS